MAGNEDMHARAMAVDTKVNRTFLVNEIIETDL